MSILASRTSQGPKRRDLRTAFARAGERSFSGYVFNPDDPCERFAIEILVDGCSVKVVQANEYVRELGRDGIGDGCYGFSLLLDDAVIGDAAIVEARLANFGCPIGAPLDLDLASTISVDRDGSGLVRWVGGLRFAGWMSTAHETPSANVFVDGVLVSRVHASGWSHVGTSETDVRAVRSFDLHLPRKFGDANIHQLAVTDDNGEHLRGSPLAFLAAADGLKEALARSGSGQEELRAELLEQLLPMSIPFSRYGEWRGRIPAAAGPPSPLRGAIVMVGAGAMDDTLESLGDQSVSAWVAAALPTMSGPTEFPPEQALAFLRGEAIDVDFVIFGLAGVRFSPDALHRIADAFSSFDQTLVVYGDLEIQGRDGSVWPLGLPAFDYERLLEQGYCAHLFAVRRPLAERQLAAGGQNLYRLFNSIFDAGVVPPTQIAHLSGPLGALPRLDTNAAALQLAKAGRAHLARRGIEALVTPVSGSIFPAVHVVRQFDRPDITIVIPTRNQRAPLQACVESIRPAVDKTQAKILIVDNDSSEAETLSYLAEIDGSIATVLRVPGPFNFARLNNCAARTARGELLCLLSSEIRALDAAWLDEMLGRISVDDVGSVGALLVWESGVVRHGGLALGPDFSVAPAFSDRIEDDPGYGDLLRVAHECSAVTAACLLTRRRDYLDLGGMDEVRFPINFCDVDYCLKLRAAGKRIVFTPHAKLRHMAASRGSQNGLGRRDLRWRELQSLRAKWGNVLAADPYYNPMLSLDSIPFSALAWPARAVEPRFNTAPVPIEIPSGF
jgi:GT2 family glycosyltransferase